MYEILDLVLSEYSSLDFILSLPVDKFVKLIGKLKERIRKDKYWELYLVVYPTMTKDSFKSFDRFYESFTKKQMTAKTKETNGGTGAVSGKDKAKSIIDRVSRYLKKK
jgi:hypothetical protein